MEPGCAVEVKDPVVAAPRGCFRLGTGIERSSKRSRATHKFLSNRTRNFRLLFYPLSLAARGEKSLDNA